MTAAIESARPVWYRRSLLAVFIASFFTQNAIALPYVARNGATSAKDFFVGDILKTTPGRFAMVDLGYVVLGFHLWAFTEARRLSILRWWIASVALTFGVGIATAIPFFLLARDRALSLGDGSPLRERCSGANGSVS